MQRFLTKKNQKNKPFLLIKIIPDLVRDIYAKASEKSAVVVVIYFKNHFF